MLAVLLFGPFLAYAVFSGKSASARLNAFAALSALALLMGVGETIQSFTRIACQSDEHPIQTEETLSRYTSAGWHLCATLVLGLLGLVTRRWAVFGRWGIGLCVTTILVPAAWLGFFWGYMVDFCPPLDRELLLPVAQTSCGPKSLLQWGHARDEYLPAVSIERDGSVYLESERCEDDDLRTHLAIIVKRMSKKQRASDGVFVPAEPLALLVDQRTRFSAVARVIRTCLTDDILIQRFVFPRAVADTDCVCVADGVVFATTNRDQETVVELNSRGLDLSTIDRGRVLLRVDDDVLFDTAASLVARLREYCAELVLLVDER